jgi:hypothetical protein
VFLGLCLLLVCVFSWGLWYLVVLCCVVRCLGGDRLVSVRGLCWGLLLVVLMYGWAELCRGAGCGVFCVVSVVCFWMVWFCVVL